jgi:3-hydroxyacyl-CoA dehydrogenase/enoyl-CoA hydratase/3-hydroxybutyryl-CoA epimerase
VVTSDSPGFVVNRILGPYLNEAGWLLSDGATIEQIDGAAKSFGMPMGPVRLLDEIGLDVARHVASVLHDAYGERMLPSPPLQALAGGDRLGKKNGRGFYKYEATKGGSRDAGVDETVYADLALAAPTRDRPDDDEIRMRLVLAMVNEAARTIADRVVRRAGELDLAMIMGTGFPPFTGGLLRFADTMGLDGIEAYLEDLTRRAGTRFEPAPLLHELAEKSKTFYAAFG